MDKRGISTIIASVLIVLVTVTGVTLLWLGLGSFLDVDIKTFDTRISIITSTGYTFYDPQNGDGTVLVQVESRGMDTPNYLQLILTLADGSEKVSVHDAPFSNSRTTLYLDAKDIDPQKVSVAPIFIVDGKAVLGNRITPINLPRRNEDQVTFYSSFGTPVDPEAVVVKQGPLVPTPTSTPGEPGSPIPSELCELVSNCQDHDGDGVADLPESCLGEPNSNGYYTLCTCEDLSAINGVAYDQENFIVMEDIDCSDGPLQGPIGGDDFEGEYWPIENFDGNGKKISNVNIVRDVSGESFTNSRALGLFPYFSGSIYDLTLENIVVDGTGFNYVGGLVGYNTGSIQDSVYITSSVDGEDTVGGLVGYNSGTLTSLDVTLSVTGNNYVGGLVGRNEGDISDSNANVQIEGLNYVGGLVGFSEGLIERSSSNGDVGAQFDYAGGLVGTLSNGGAISASYSLADVDGEGTVGGLVGSGSNCDISYSYAMGSVEGDNYFAGFVGSLIDCQVLQSYTSSQILFEPLDEDYSGFVASDSTGSVLSGLYDSTVNPFCNADPSCYEYGFPSRSIPTSYFEDVEELQNIIGWEEVASNGYWTLEQGEYPKLFWE